MADRHLRLVKIENVALAFAICMLALLPSSGRASPPASAPTNNSTTLFAQSAAETLSRAFASRDISFLLLDARTGELLASRWDHPDLPIPLGSLVKPFVALAYGEQHDFKYPLHTCRGTATGCWLPRGHGQLDLSSAVANSCNSYFRMLTARLTVAEVSSTATRFGLDPPAREASGPALAGLGPRWQISPLRMARAHLELIRRRTQPGVSQVLEGMAQSARSGTGAEVDRALPYSSALVKTGTAACTHAVRAPGDGFAVAMVPADQPHLLLLVRVHGVPGSRAAKTAGQMLRRIEE